MSSKCARREARHEKPMFEFCDVWRSLEGMRNTFTSDSTSGNTGNGLQYYKAIQQQVFGTGHL